MKMLTLNLCVFLVLAISHFVASKKVICYYGSWATYRSGEGKYDIEHINPHLCTHLIYAFVGVDAEGNVVPLDTVLDLPDNGGRDNYGKFNALKKQNENLKTLLSVGGWNEKSAKFSAMAGSHTLRQNFLHSALKTITTHGFNGLDINWVYPSRRDSVHGEADIYNFTTLLKEIRELFENRGLLLTASVSSVKAAAIRSYDVKGISQYLDIVSIMSYDLNGAWHPVTGHNAPLHRGEGDEELAIENLNTVDESLKYWIGAGCPPEKIAVGVPFYGRTFTLKSASANGVRAPTSGVGIKGPYTDTYGVIGYNEICLKLRTESWTKRFDSQANAPYAVNDRNWVSYDDATSIIAKIEYAKRLNIPNVMIWSIETDDFHGLCGGGVNPLLQAINKAL